jgi:ABC-2 type transport system permease protein
LVWRIAQRELIEVWRDGGFRLAALVVVGLLAVTLAVGGAGAARQSRDRAAADAADRAEWLAQGTRNPHSAAHFGRYAFKPTGPISFFDPGVDRFTGVAVWLEAHFQDTFRHRPAEDATALQRFAELSAASILQQLVPLFIVLFAFGQFGGERERGLLCQLLATGVRPRQLLVGKFCGSALSLTAVFVPAVAIGAGALAASQGEASSLRSPDRFVWLAGGYVLYFAAILAAALGVSARVRSARTALLALLAGWAFCCLLVPRLAADIAAFVAPSPSSDAFWRDIEHDIEEGFDGSGNAPERARALRERVLAEYGVTAIDALPVSFDALSLQDTEDFGNRVFDRHYHRLWETFTRQQQVERLVGLLSPLTGVRALSMALAGTDLAHFKRFGDAAEAYRRVLVRRLNEEFRDKAGAAAYAYVDDGSLWRTIADFSYTPPDTAWILARQRGQLASILGWVAASWAFALWSVRRMRVI